MVIKKKPETPVRPEEDPEAASPEEGGTLLSHLQALRRVVLISAAAVLLPYMLATGTLKIYPLSAGQTAAFLLVGILHTGIAYALYFWSVERLRAQTSALFSYIDPVTAVLLSALLLHEPLTPAVALGAVLILGSAAASERF